MDLIVYKHFNSHAHVERDLQRVWNPMLKKISTHTLTWSVTEYRTAFMHNVLISTHTLTWSVTTTKLHTECGSIHFNSHAHVERDSAVGF